MTSSTVPAPRGTLPETAMKQQLSIAYIRAVATTAGLVIGDLAEDYDGIDMTIRSFANYGFTSNSSLDVQLKCTSQSSVMNATDVSWSLTEHGYTKLQKADRFTLGILALLVVPPDWKDWIHQDEDRLLSRGCMYFSVARDWADFPDGQGSATVKCSREDVLDVDNMLSLMHLAAKAKAGKL